MADILAKIQKIRALNQNVHWFCSRNDGDLDSHHEAEQRRQLVLESLMIFSFDGDLTTEPKTFLSAGITRNLLRCEHCIASYYKGKTALLNDLRENGTEDDEVDAFADIFDNDAITRVERGLSRARDRFRTLPDQERRPQSLSRSELMTLYESLCCEKFINDEARLSGCFDELFSLCQRHGTLKTTFIPPAMTRFAFGPNKKRREWALSGFETHEPIADTKDFDFSMRPAIAKALASASVLPIQDVQARVRFWTAIRFIILSLSPGLITHSLRNMEIDVCRLVLDYLNIDSPTFLPLLYAITCMLQHSAKDFWDAMGAVSPQSIIEGIFHNGQYRRLLSQEGSSDVPEPKTSADLVSWAQPFVKSMSASSRPPSCRSLASWFFRRLQQNSLSRQTCDELRQEGVRVLKIAMLSLLREKATPDAVSHAVGAELLGIFMEFSNEILDMVANTSDESPSAESSDLCREIVQTALTLECRLLRLDHLVLSKGRPLSDKSKARNPDVWRYIVNKADSVDTALIEAALPAAVELSWLGQFGPKGDTALLDEKKHFNQRFREFIDLMCKIFQRAGEMPLEAMRSFVSNPVCRSAFASACLSSEGPLYEAAVDVIKSMSGESIRQDAFRHLFEADFVGTLNDFTSAIDRVRKGRLFYACPRLLRTSADIVDILCDAQNGLLRDRTLDSIAQEALLAYWDSQWSALTIIYSNTEDWAREQDRGVMKEFCRDTMQFSDNFFANHIVLANALTNITDTRPAPAHSLLVGPLGTLETMWKWLRLKDEYLAAKAVSIIVQLMNELDSSDLTVSEKVMAELKLVVSGRTSTILTPQQKAELGKAAQFEDRELALHTSAQRSLKVGSAGYTASTVTGQVQPKMRTGIIDMKMWQAKTGFADEEPDSKAPSLHGNRSSNDIRNASRPAHLSSSKNQQTLAKKEARPRTKPDMAAFMEQRMKEKQEKRNRDLTAAAKMRSLDSTSLTGQLAGAGSALAALGDVGKVRPQKASGLMVSSDNSDDSENDYDATLFGSDQKGATKTSAVGIDAVKSRSKPVRGPVKKTKQARSQKDMKARLTPDLTYLHRTILGWDLFISGDFPPGSDSHNYTLITDSFRMPHQYRSTFQPLLLLEAWQGLQQTREENLGKPFRVNVANRITLSSFIDITVVLDMLTQKNAGLSETDLLILSKDQDLNADNSRCLARIQKVKRMKQSNVEVTFRINPDSNKLLNFLIIKKDIFIHKLSSMTPLEREYGALMGLEYYDLCDEIIRAIPSPMLDYSEVKITEIGEIYGLNPAQAKALQSAVDNDAFTLIQGPPGSGKTKTIVSIVGALLTEQLQRAGSISINRPGLANLTNQSARASTPPKKLLVCAPSNAAVDELVMRLMDGVKTSTGKNHQISVVRLGRSDRVNQKVTTVTLDELVNQKLNLGEMAEIAPDQLGLLKKKHKETQDTLSQLTLTIEAARTSGAGVSQADNILREQLGNQRRNLSTQIDNLKDGGNTKARNADIHRRHVQQEILDSAHVLCATLSGSGHDMFQQLNVDFETVVIDEAAQSVELSALIPLKYGCQKCIMVGDPKQLPPTVLSREAIRFQYEQSLFVRMQSNNPRDVHLLDTQYRMHPEISRFPSKAFYDGRLLDGEHIAEHRFKSWHKDLYLSPYRFFDIQGTQQHGPRGHSLTNMAEVNMAMQLYGRLLAVARGYDFAGKIGIITPYKAQLQRLREAFSRRFGEDVLKIIDFNTTDAFQGRESEVIMFSCVRASSRGIGFLSDIRRMNVGITRAKCSLWVLGSADALRQGEYWQKLISDAKERDRFTSGIADSVLQGPLILAPQAAPLTETNKNLPSPAFLKQGYQVEDKMDVDEVSLDSTAGPTNTIQDKALSHGQSLVEKRRRSSSNSAPGSRSTSKAPRVGSGDSRKESVETAATNLSQKLLDKEKTPIGEPRPRIARPVKPPGASQKKASNIFIQPKRR